MANSGISQSLLIYLKEWVAEATNNNAEYDCYSYENETLYFKCKTCALFRGWHYMKLAGGAIPYDLQEWVKQHRHEQTAQLTAQEKADALALKNIQQIKALRAKAQQNAADQQSFKPSDYQNVWNPFSQIESQGAGIPGAAAQFYTAKAEAQKQLAQAWFEKYIKSTPALLPEPPKPKIVPPLPQPRGRKFRD